MMSKQILRRRILAAVIAGGVFFTSGLDAKAGNVFGGGGLLGKLSSKGCGCEAVHEPGCGIEPGCGLEPACGIEPGCGIEPNCGIEPGCGLEPACGFEPNCGCGGPACGSKKGLLGRAFSLKNNPIYRTLDTVAGGIEKVLHLDDRRHCDSGCATMPSDGCDDGCDSAMMHELHMAVPMPPVGSYGEPIHSHSHSSVNSPPAPIVAPHREMTQSPRTLTAPPSPPASIQKYIQPIESKPQTRTRMRMSEPTMAPRSMSAPAMRSRPAVPAPPIPIEKSDSLFDTLSNPFGDDEVRVRRFEPVRPSHYEVDQERSPSDLSRVESSSSRRRSSDR